MKQIGEIIPLIQPQQTGSLPSLSRPSGTLTPVSQDSDGQHRMAEMLTQCFQALNLFGKQPEQLAAAIPLFQMVLADYPIERIQRAFTGWLQTHSSFPAPADIVSLIERGGKPPLDRAVYVSISRKPGDQRTSADWEYMRDYEKSMMEG